MPKLIVANWKLNPVKAEEAVSLAGAIQTDSIAKVVLCPPIAFTGIVKFSHLGAQDCSAQISGPYTGQISAAELASLGISYCIVGHSERRTLGETDLEVRSKITALLEYKITPVVCVGYGVPDASQGLDVATAVAEQLSASLGTNDPSRVVVAYEPVWAIGTGHSATVEHIAQVASVVKKRFSVSAFLYGGSVNSGNAGSFLSANGVDGLLVGGASLDAVEFNKIINIGSQL